MGILSYLYYAYFTAGSVTLGYLLLRLTYPEVRLLSTEQKLGNAAVSGALLAIASLAVDFFYDGQLEVLSGNGTYPIIVFLLFLLSFVFMKLYFVFSKPEYLTVGVPFQNPINIVIETHEGKSEQKENEVYEKIIGRRSGSDMAERSAEKKKDLITKLRQSDMTPVSQEVVKLEKKGGLFSGLTAMFSGGKKKEVQLDELRKTKMIPQPEQKIPLGRPVIQQIPQNKAVQVMPARGNAPGTAAKSSPASATQSTEQPRKGFMGMIGDIVGKEQPGGSGKTPPDQVPPAEGSEMVHKSIADIRANVQKEKSAMQAAMEDKDKIIYKEGNLSDNSGNIPIAKRHIPLEPGENESLSSLKSEIMKDQPINIPQKEKPAEEPAFKSDPKVLGEQKKRAEEMQADMILEDILPKEIREAKPQPVVGQHRLYQMVQQQGKPDVIVHRRYMLKGTPGEAPQGVSVIAQGDVAGTDNFDSLVNDVYSQLKDNKKEGLKSNLSVAPPKDLLGAANTKPGQPAPLTFDDLLGEKPAEKKTEGLGEAPQQSSVFGQLSDIAGGTEKKPEKKSDISFVKIQAEKGMGCPTCHSKNTKIIFCPYCGTGMCANCSPNIKIQEGAFVYMCPKCKEDVDVRKKQQQASANAG
ncbi:MAG: zinc ribbon domain-containing protein [Candidatus Micrarchaeota archaeon]